MFDDVSDNSQAVMAPVDALPPEWRALVHEYGRNIVLSLRDSGRSLEDAEDDLWRWRSRRQREWLATDYITPKTRQGFEERA